MSNEITAAKSGQLMHEVIVKGNLADLSVADRTNYYVEVCKSVGLNPLTKPFEYIVLNEKLTLYAKRDATDQLRQIHGVSITISAREKLDGVYVVTAKAVDKSGRTDESTGAVALEKADGEWVKSAAGKNYFKKNGKTVPLTGDDLANAYMKAETKAKRRVTLSICGLGMLDETEIETIPMATHSNITAFEVDETKAPSPFKTATLRNQYQKNVVESLDACQTTAELNTIIELNKEKFAQMRDSGDERDAMSAEEIQKRYRLRLQQIKAPAKENEELPAFIRNMDEEYKQAMG